jgi:hypothetical protein
MSKGNWFGPFHAWILLSWFIFIPVLMLVVIFLTLAVFRWIGQ